MFNLVSIVDRLPTYDAARKTYWKVIDSVNCKIRLARRYTKCRVEKTNSAKVR